MFDMFDTFVDRTLGGPAPNVPQAIIHWVTEDLIKYRDGATAVTTACVFDYGLRNVEEEENEETPKPLANAKGKQRAAATKPAFPSPFTPSSIDLNIANQEAAILNNAFLHIWDITKEKAGLSTEGELCYSMKI
jgi:hypothetical protein